MPTYDLTIDSTSRAFRFQSLSIAQIQNGQDRLLVDLYSADASYRPSLGDEIVLTEDASPIFGGFIDRVTETGAGQQPITPIITRVSATDYKQLALRRYVSESIASGTLKAALTTLVTNYLSAYGVTLDAGQVNGPTLEALSYDYRRLSEVLDELSDMTGYVWEIDASKVLSMYVPGTTACSFNATTSTVIGDVEVEPNRQDYANRIILKCGPSAVVEVTDSFAADGIDDTFDLNYACVGGQNSLDGTRGYVVNSPPSNQFETLRHPTDADSATWTIDKAAKTITRTSAPAGTQTISITYDAQFPFTVIAEDTGEQTTHGIWEKVIFAPGVLDRDAADDLAAGLLTKGLLTPQTVRYNTYQTGAAPGLSQTITIAARNVNATFTITEVVTRDAGRGDGTLLRSVTAIEGTDFLGSWRDVIRAWLSEGSGGGGAVSTGGGKTPPGGLDTHVQYNDGGAFGGDAGLTWDKTNTLLTVTSTDGDVEARGTETGALYGVNGKEALVAITLKDAFDTMEGWAIAFEGEDDEAMTATVGSGGDAWIQYNGQDLNLASWVGPLNLVGQNITISPGALNSEYTDLSRLTSLDQVALKQVTITTTPFTISTTESTQGTVYLWNRSSAGTVNLQALSAFLSTPGTGLYRVIVIRNIGTATLTLDGNSAETIDGATTLDIEPGQSVALVAMASEWKIVASHARGEEIDITTLDGFPGGGGTFLRDDGTFAAPAGGGSEIAVLTADPGSPSDDTAWIVRTGTSPGDTVKLKARINGTTYDIAGIVLT